MPRLVDNPLPRLTGRLEKVLESEPAVERMFHAWGALFDR